MRSEVQVLPGPRKGLKSGLAAFFTYGAIAQLVAHLLCKQRVAGSNPASSTFTAMNDGASMARLGGKASLITGVWIVIDGGSTLPETMSIGND